MPKDYGWSALDTLPPTWRSPLEFFRTNIPRIAVLLYGPQLPGWSGPTIDGIDGFAMYVIIASDPQHRVGHHHGYPPDRSGPPMDAVILSRNDVPEWRATSKMFQMAEQFGLRLGDWTWDTRG